MICPPDLKTLERRLGGRKTESEEQRKERLARVRYELEQKNGYDYTVINDDLQTAKRALQAIIKKERNA